MKDFLKIVCASVSRQQAKTHNLACKQVSYGHGKANMSGVNWKVKVPFPECQDCWESDGWNHFDSTSANVKTLGPTIYDSVLYIYYSILQLHICLEYDILFVHVCVCMHILIKNLTWHVLAIDLSTRPISVYSILSKRHTERCPASMWSGGGP